jgi:hypothetical protein
MWKKVIIFRIMQQMLVSPALAFVTMQWAFQKWSMIKWW